MKARWYGVKINVLNTSADGNWVTVKFLEKCSHFDNNEIVHLSTYGIRYPVTTRRCPHGRD